MSLLKLRRNDLKITTFVKLSVKMLLSAIVNTSFPLILTNCKLFLNDKWNLLLRRPFKDLHAIMYF